MSGKNRSIKGQVLKIKRGFNPNSSSIGSIIFTLPHLLLLLSVLFGPLIAFIMRFFIIRLIRKDNRENSAINTDKDSL